MAKILFISETYIKDNTPLTNNIDVEQIVPHIAFSQDSEVQSMLGTTFYNELQDSYSAQTLTVKETELVGHIKIWLAWLSSANAIPLLNMQLRNKGVIKFKDDTLDQAEAIDGKYITSVLKQRADFYGNIVSNYLCNNSQYFPSYVTPASDANLIPNGTKVFRSPLIFENNHCNTCGNLNCICINV